MVMAVLMRLLGFFPVLQFRQCQCHFFLLLLNQERLHWIFLIMILDQAGQFLLFLQHRPFIFALASPSSFPPALAIVVLNQLRLLS